MFFDQRYTEIGQQKMMRRLNEGTIQSSQASYAIKPAVERIVNGRVYLKVTDVMTEALSRLKLGKSISLECEFSLKTQRKPIKGAMATCIF